MVDIRMPDGTVLRGIPEGVSKDQVQAKFVKKFGQRHWDAMAGTTSASADPAVERHAAPAKEIPQYDKSEFDPMFESAAQRHSIPQGFLRAQATKESGLDPKAEGPDTGEGRGTAKGLMQTMDETAAEMGITDPYDPQQSIDGGAAYLRKKIDEFDGDVEKGLAAYHSGAGNVRKWEKQYGDKWQKGLGPEGADYVQTLAPQYESFYQSDLHASAKKESGARTQLTEKFPNRLTPKQIQQEIQSASQDAQYNAEYFQSSQFAEEEMPGAALANQDPREAAQIKMQEFVDSGKYTPRELGMSKSEYGRMKKPVEPPKTEEELEMYKRTGQYYANAIHDPDGAAQMFPEIHAIEQDKIEGIAANKYKSPEDPSLEGRPDDTVMNWVKSAGTDIVESTKMVWNGITMSMAGADRAGAERRIAGHAILERAAEEYEDLSEENRRMIQATANRAGMSVDEMMRGTIKTYLDAAEKEAEDMVDVYESLNRMQAASPKGASTTTTGYYADLLLKNSAQASIIVAGMVTRSPSLAGLGFGSYVFGQEYGARRLEGRTHEEAMVDAQVAMVFEGLTEAIPVARALKVIKQGNRGKLVRLMEVGATEFVQETTVEALSIAYDWGVIGEEKSWSEIWRQMRDAGIVGLAMGTVISAPAVGMMDSEMANMQEEINAAKKDLQKVATKVMDPANRGTMVGKEEAQAAHTRYVNAVRAKRKVIADRKQAEAEKKKAKVEKKETKRKKKLTPLQAKRETAQETQRTAGQAVEGAVTEDQLRVADTLERAGQHELTEEDASLVEELLDLGYAKVTKAGTLIVLPAGKKRLEAVRVAQEGVSAPVADEVVEPVTYDTEDARARRQARGRRRDEEIGALIRGDDYIEFEGAEREEGAEPSDIIQPVAYRSPERRHAELMERVDEKIKGVEARAKIATAILQEEQRERAYEEQEKKESAQRTKTMNEGYDQRLRDQNEVEADVALNLSGYDQRSQTGYVGTRLGDVFREAEQKLQRAADRARKQLNWNKPVQGTLFDIGAVLAKGTADYARAVKIGALKLAQHGAKYSAWAADMVGEFGDSIRPILAKIYHDAKKNVANVLKWSHERHGKGPKKGQLKYAPKQYAKPGQIRSLRAVLQRLAKEGASGRMWYERTGKAILRITGKNMQEARKLAGLLAIYSSGTSVGPNLTNALKMWSIYHGRKKVPIAKRGTLAGRFSEQDRTAIEWLESEASDELFAEKFGDKRFPFFTNIMRSVDPATYEYGQGVTIDLWMMRALGYDTPAPTDSQFAFGAVELRMLAEKLGWERQQVQAAVWVAIKARWEFIQKRAKERAVKEGLAEIGVGPKGAPIFDVIGKDRAEQIVNEKKIIALFREEALSASVGQLTKKLDQSKRDFSDYMETQYATISWEAEPSTAFGMIFNSMPIEDKMALQYEVSELLTNPKTGREFVAEWLGLLGADQFQGPGAWDGAIGAVTQNSVLAPAGHKQTAEKVKGVQPESATAMDGYAAIMGFLLKQDAVAWHRPFYSAALKRSNGVSLSMQIDMDASTLRVQTQKLYSAIVIAAEEAGHNQQTGLDWAPIVLNGEIRVLNFSEVPQREFHKIIQTAANNANVGGDLEVFQSDGNLVMNDWEKNPNGESYEEAINQSENPRVKKAFGRAKSQFTKRLDAIYKKYAEKYASRRRAEVQVTQVREGKKAPAIKKGWIRFRHFGLSDVKALKVEYFGTGIKGAERKRGSERVISAYPDKGFKKEVGLGKFEYVIDVQMDSLYNANEDPSGFMETSRLQTGAIDMHAYEKKMKAAGFAGYYIPDADGNLKGQARFFYDLTVGPTAATATMSMPEGPKIVIKENSLDEFEVKEKNGEIYFTDDMEDAIGTARSIWGHNVTIEFQDEYGDTMEIVRPKIEELETDITRARRKRAKIEKEASEAEDWENHKKISIINKKIADVGYLEDRIALSDTYYETVGEEGTDVPTVDLTSDEQVKAKFSDWLFKGTFDRNAMFDMESPSVYKISRSETHKATPQRLLDQFRALQAERDELQFELDAMGIAVEELSEATVIEFGQRNPKIPSADVEESFREFFDEWMEVSEDNPLSRDERVFEYGSAVTLRPSVAEGVVWLDSIRSFEKGTGQGSQALKFLTEMADRHGVTLRLYARPYETEAPGLEQETLIRWYEQNGFTKEFSEQMGEHSYRMTRNPQNAGTSTFAERVEPMLGETAVGVAFGLPVAEAQNITTIFASEFGLDNFVVVESAADLPAELYQQLLTFGHQDYIQGVFHEDPIKGPTVYVVAHNIIDGPTMLWEVLLHETVGHFGLQALLGVKKYNQMMDAIIRAFPKEVKARQGIGKGQQSKRMAAEEVFAYMVQEELVGLDLTKVKMSFIDRMIYELTMILNRLGIKKMSRNDMLNLMFRSLDFVRKHDTAFLQKRSRKVEKMRIARINAEENAIRAEKLAKEKHMAAVFSLRDARRADPDLDSFLNKIGHDKSAKLRSLRDWWELRKDNLVRAAEIEMFDQFAGIKHAERDLGIFGPESGYISVRLTAGSDVVIRSALENGVPMWDIDGSVRIDNNHEGLLEILAPVSVTKDMLKAFEMFIVARRAKRLKKEDRERLFTRKEITAAFQYIRKNRLYGQFKQTAQEMADYKSRILDFAEEAGLIDPDARVLWEHNDHVPFYRVLAETDKSGPYSSSRIGRVGKVIHRLRGGKQALRHPLESIVQNIGMLLEASMKNRAMADVINNFDGTGIISKAPQAEITQALVPMNQVKDMLHENGVALDAVGEQLLTGVQKLMSLQAPTANNVVSVQVKGKRQYYYVHDTGVMRGMDNVSPTQWTSLMKILRFPKRVITLMITRMPDFIFKNWFRDIWHSVVLQRHGQVLPVWDSVRGWAKAIAQDATYRDVLSGGGMFDSGYVNASDPKQTNLAIRKKLMGRGRHNVLDTPRKLANFYMRIANGAENAHRLVVYQKALKHTGSRKQALFESRDLMDFSVRGANPIVRFLAETVPFWGARVQGISRTGKGFTESPFLTTLRAFPITLASMALYGINRDDDRYKGLNDYQKRMYYHFYDVFQPGDHWQLPKPFEVGAIFSTTPEILMEYALSQEPDRGKAAAHAIYWTAREMLSLGPEIQALTPIYELLTNENLFTEAPILTEWEKQQDPSTQASYRTSKSIQAIADSMPPGTPDWARSPKQLEHLVRGYLGSVMDYVLVASDMIYYKAHEDEAQPPTMRWDETPFMKAFRREPKGKYDRYQESMYDVLEEANKIHNSINKLKKTPGVAAREEARELREENMALLYARGPTNKAAQKVREINAALRATYAHPTMSPTDKRARVDMLLESKSKAAERAYDYRPGGQKNKFDGGSAKDSYYDQVTDFLMDLVGKPKEEQVDDLVGAHLPHTATLINDITISDEKLRRVG